MNKSIYKSSREDEKKLIEFLDRRTDTEASRIKRYLAMKDLSRERESPLYEIIERVKKAPILRDFDEIETPEIVPADVSFDLFNFPADHHARSKSDTY
jgi:phenylalanyl-tRNA synthetase alpha subunit